jgi:hypothetical protein
MPDEGCPAQISIYPVTEFVAEQRDHSCGSRMDHNVSPIAMAGRRVLSLKYDALNSAVTTMLPTAGPPMSRATSSTRANSAGASARSIATYGCRFRHRKGCT